MERSLVFEDVRKELFRDSEIRDTNRLQKIIQSLNSLCKQRTDSSFQSFLEECAMSMAEKANQDTQSAAAWIILHTQLIQGLLHLMIVQEPDINFFPTRLYGEASIVKLSFLFRLFLWDSTVSNIISVPQHLLFLSIVQAGFQLFLDIFQSSKLVAAFSRPEIFWHSAWNLLEDLQRFNQDEWDACLATVLHQILSHYISNGPVLHQILSHYISNGPTVLQEPALAFIMKLFSKPCFAMRFLNSITIFPGYHNGSIDRGALNAALQIFEATYRTNPLTIVTACASKIVDPLSDAALVRLECLALLAKFRSFPKSSGMQAWPADVVHDIMTSVLYDSSVRVRRSAFQLLVQIEPPEVEERGGECICHETEFQIFR